MAEAVRLVVWDLDDTFWEGTVSEGGISQYLQANHDIVVQLAKRGIQNSICSKNDPHTIRQILDSLAISEYFIFPSISWEPKGPRLASLIESVQLRPENVMFIDDNPGNRAEAAAFVPGLQIEDQYFIPKILTDFRFQGKNDEMLSRLAQYKLLEARKADERLASGDNVSFLRGCDIRVHLDYDVESNINRAIELINRTNQLNFTKIRLPEDPAEAAMSLRTNLNDHFRQCALVRVMDKYGDHGFVGFFMIRNDGAIDPISGQVIQHLEHYCFSCRVLGMLVEYWLYERLGCPRLAVAGEVLTDISIKKTVDWIRLVQSISKDNDSMTDIAPEIRFNGGCESHSVAHYLNVYCPRVVVTGNFHAGTTFVRVNSSSLLLSACERNGPLFEQEAVALKIPYEMLVSNYFSQASDGTLFIFGGQMDTEGSQRYRHRVHKWELALEPHGLSGMELTTTSAELISARVAGLNFSDDAKRDVLAVARHINHNYEATVFEGKVHLEPLMKKILDLIPAGSKIIIILDHSHVRTDDGLIVEATWANDYAKLMRKIASPYAFVGLVSFSDWVQRDEEIHVGGNHYDRMVYCRMAEAIVSIAKQLPSKTAERAITTPLS